MINDSHVITKETIPKSLTVLVTTADQTWHFTDTLLLPQGQLAEFSAIIMASTTFRPGPATDDRREGKISISDIDEVRIMLFENQSDWGAGEILILN